MALLCARQAKWQLLHGGDNVFDPFSRSGLCQALRGVLSSRHTLAHGGPLRYFVYLCSHPLYILQGLTTGCSRGGGGRKQNKIFLLRVYTLKARVENKAVFFVFEKQITLITQLS